MGLRFIMPPGIDNEGVQIIIEKLVEEGEFAFAERIIRKHVFGPLPEFVEAKNRGVGDGFLKVGILDGVAGFG